MGYVCRYKNGVILPFSTESEEQWPNILRLFMYLVLLGYCFLGIALISDIFMAGIEKVTSWKKRVKDPKTGRTVTVMVWNPTVANLTLMALGSSAPEILLSVIEITTNDMFVGDLGAGTIVGSAAFNLLVISAVCVAAFPDGEVRYIKETSVYAITATCSVLAYLWLMFILMVSSPDVIHIWEGVVTLLFCPMLVYAAYWADRGWFCWQKSEEREQHQAIPENVTKEELAQIEQQIRDDHGAHLTQEQVIDIMKARYFTQRSRAYYRHAAKHAHSSHRGSASGPPDLTVKEVFDTADLIDKDQKFVSVGFACARYAFLEDCGHAKLALIRSGPTQNKATIQYSTRDGTAHADFDYVAESGTVTFEAGEREKVLQIKILDDNAYEDNEEFYVDLFGLELEDGATAHAQLSDIATVTVVIVDDDEPGVLRFVEEEVVVEEGVEDKTLEIAVERDNGASGTVSCRYYTEDMTAVADMDYVAASGTIELESSAQSAVIPIVIKAKGRYKNKTGFNVCLVDPKGCRFDHLTDGGEDKCICHVLIQGKDDETRKKLFSKMESTIFSQRTVIGTRNYVQQFQDALFAVVEDEEEEDGESEQPTLLDWVVHIAGIPWKLLFAFVPPPDYCGGWACFFGALAMIALVTAIVGDVANLLGCCMSIEPEITAITFVALGTSLPDTFASKTAAEMDPYADASIGNITGSNSVNVFIGLGLSWSLAAFYWELGEPNGEWNKRLAIGGKYEDVADNVRSARSGKNAVFVVPQGTFGFNLAIFSFNAFCALQHLWARRRRFGGELGGPKRGFFGQYFSASFLVCQWFIYIGASSVIATVGK